MNTSRRNTVCLCLLAGCLLAVGLPSQAAADPYEFDYYQGPTTGVVSVFGFLPFHSHMTNTGDNSDSYTVSITADDPADWTFGICVGEICYPPTTTEVTVPSIGSVAPGESVDFTFDVTALSEGHSFYTVTVVSNSDGAVVGTWDYEAFTPVEEQAMLLSAGEGVTHADLFEFISFHPVLYNSGMTEDSYTLTMIRGNQPAMWSTSFCVNEICYPPTTETVQIPADGVSTIGSGERTELSIDFSILEEGAGTVTIVVVSNNDPSLRSTATYTVTTGSVVGVEDLPSTLLSDLSAVPNPFNPKTDIRFTVGGTTAMNAVIDIFDASGRRVRTLVAGDLAPGSQSVSWDGRSDSGNTVSAGVYLASVHVGNAQQTIKMSLVK